MEGKGGDDDDYIHMIATEKRNEKTKISHSIEVDI